MKSEGGICVCCCNEGSPEVNSQWHDDSLEIFRNINIGIGTALDDKRLVVPVRPEDGPVIAMGSGCGSAYEGEFNVT